MINEKNSCEDCMFVEQDGMYEICTLGDKCENQARE